MSNENVTVNEKQKDTIFRMLYRDKKNLLELYNGLNNTNYTNEEDLSVETLENALYMSVKNDVAFVLDHRLNLYEHQSTYNPNMPLRDLFYVSSEYQKMVKDSSLYSTKKVRIPAPRFIVFYNGIKERPEREVWKLSDLYEIEDKDPSLELKVTILNINAGKNVRLREKCKTLNDYMLYVERVRYYMKNKRLSVEAAVSSAINECIREGILADFLSKQKAEAIKVSIFEFDEEKEWRLFGEAERSLGYEKGKEEERKELLVSLVKDKVISITEAAKRLNISKEEMQDILNK